MKDSKVWVWAALLILIVSLVVSGGCKKQAEVAQEPAYPGLAEVTETDTASTPSSLSEFRLTAYDTPPTPVRNPMPVYPPAYVKSGIQGVVLLEVEVFADGKVGEVKVMKSLLKGEGGLDETAVAAVKEWLFKPAHLNNRPITAKVNVTIPFALK